MDILLAGQQIIEKRLKTDDASSWMYKSKADLGDTILKDLKERFAITKFAEDPNSRAIIENINDLPLFGNEYELVAYFTPILQNIFSSISISPILKVFNSENYQWLKRVGSDPKFDLKPDLFVIRNGLQRNKEVPTSQSTNLYQLREAMNFEYKFAVIEDFHDIKCLIRGVIDFKLSIKNDGRGDMISYLLTLSQDDKDNVYYGMLCDKSNIELWTCKRGAMTLKQLTFTWQFRLCKISFFIKKQMVLLARCSLC